MFREFNIKFEDVEMIEGADNLLEGTEVTKVIMRGDNKMSSLNSAFRNCLELDTIDGEVDLNEVENIDNLLKGTELVTTISLKNINNENISVQNSFNDIKEINIGGNLYNKKAMQNVIASKEWTFDNINYTGEIKNKITLQAASCFSGNKIKIENSLEQKAKSFEIIGETLENLEKGDKEATLTGITNEYILDSQDSINAKLGEYEVVELYGGTYQNLNNIYSIGDLYVGEDGEPILDEEGLNQYVVKITVKNNKFGKGGRV